MRRGISAMCTMRFTTSWSPARCTWARLHLPESACAGCTRGAGDMDAVTLRSASALAAQEIRTPVGFARWSAPCADFGSVLIAAKKLDEAERVLNAATASAEVEVDGQAPAMPTRRWPIFGCPTSPSAASRPGARPCDAASTARRRSRTVAVARRGRHGAGAAGARPSPRGTQRAAGRGDPDRATPHDDGERSVSDALFRR